jgi:hypothetical protein
MISEVVIVLYFFTPLFHRGSKGSVCLYSRRVRHSDSSMFYEIPESLLENRQYKSHYSILWECSRTLKHKVDDTIKEPESVVIKWHVLELSILRQEFIFEFH